ncbi:acyl-CoA dehydrogenase [Rhodococcus sp. SGAir0479]|uniref:acyl-CoA dehydrogenase n=1 Tax=Rhodococcus sp. SGAir0479 TaxID=2567884 RepID=UPI0010CCBC6E|nr:acyl-CoA dehydrogenase [Rhodococcus sp. SGAir0479]QCQ93738.1 acyl-CoA dehydrogenase [Rhodococcus sp. SGAir0479]
MSIARTPEQIAAQDAVRALGRTGKPVAVIRDTATDAWLDLWPAVADLGLFAVTVPEERGGAGGTLVDLCVMLEQAGADLLPGPVAATAAVAHLLGTHAGSQELLDEIMSGALPVAIASPAAPRLTVSDEGVSGEVGLVAGACARSAVVVAASESDGARSWWLIRPDAAGFEVEAADTADLTTPAGRVRCTATPAVRLEIPFESVEDLHITAVASLAAGIAGRATEIAAEYAKIREQFGRPIGRFQAIKHMCSEMLCRAEQARIVAWDAAVADAHELPIAAAVAGAVALDAAVDNAKDCIQVLGGIGFTWEHDAHIYLRRALSLRQFLGGSAAWRRRTTELVRAGERRHLGVDLGDVENERGAVRGDVERIAALPEQDRRAALADSGYLAPHWPAPYGQDASAARQVLIDQELQHAGVERPDLVIGWWAMPTILQGGDPAQIERFALPTLRGEILWCQLFSEPGAGSDLASLTTAAVRVDGGWKISGQKVWNSMAVQADWAICLARTDKEAPKHRGITYFLVDMRTPGIDVRPLREITGETLFNEVFLDDVFVPDDCVVGAVNDGWRLARTTLANERVQMGGGSTLGPRMEEMIALAEGNDDPLVVDRLGYLIAQAMSNALLAHRALLDSLAGGQPGAESAIQKIVGVRERQAAAEFQLQLAGDAGLLEGPVMREFLTTRANSIAGGSTQILLSLVAERLLGLPRD